MSENDGLEKARSAAAAARDKLAQEPVCLDVRTLVSFADAFLILSGRSDRHVRSIADAVSEAAARDGDRTLGIEGYNEGRWVLVDLGDLIVHVFQHEVRKTYDLERLWSDAPVVDLGLEAAGESAGTGVR
jgi:ribosome-associated protein